MVNEKRAWPPKLVVTLILYVVYLVVGIYTYLTEGVSALFNSVTTLLTLAAIHFLLYRLLPNAHYLMIVFFAAFAQFGGMMLHFYGRIPRYDLLMHGVSGMMLFAVGDWLIAALTSVCDRERPHRDKIPLLIRIFFAMLFAIACAGIWEIFEFATDKWFGLNSQLGSLEDTMTDIIAGTVGAIFSAVVAFIFVTVLRKRIRSKE